MNQRSLIAIIILAGIGSIGSVMAFSGTISAAQGNFNNVLVTGTCTGCGGEGSFTSYATVFNGTITGTVGTTIQALHIADDKSILSYDTANNSTVLSSSQTVIGFALTGDFGSNNGVHQYAMSSSTGEYKVFFDETNILKVFKNSSLLATYTVNISQFHLGSLQSASIAISPNGKYIAIYGDDVSNTINRLVILGGS